MAYPVSQSHCEIEIENQPSPPDYHHPISVFRASTSTASDLNDSNYDVFLSHRGPDVKKSLASHLYRRLISYGLRVFLDYQEMQEGENITCQIEGAIRTASVNVVIFSPGYAESTWCLDELLLILEMEAPVIPVFYHVKPAELRWTHGKVGVYAQALCNLENKKTHEGKPRHNSATVENWRNALSRVAGITGFELDAYNGDEGELVDKVVERVMKNVKTTDLYVAKYPTGLEEKAKDFENTVLLQKHQCGKPQVMGIVGLGGVGKTTLATQLFNKKRLNYSRSYFLYNVRENASKSSLTSLQMKLLKGLTQYDFHIESVGEGIEKLKKHLSSYNVLVILDDVDDVDQVDALLAFQNVLSSDSLILITSRDRDVLTSSGVQNSSIYRLSGLNAQRSQELFCSHAFSQPHPLPGFESLVDKFLEVCDGLPLSLNVFGALLYGKNDRSYWEDQLDRLRQILPHEIRKRLQISYDALQRDEQLMFLDIACFFISEERDMAIRIWDGSGCKGLLGFQNLQNKCLVEVNNENEIKMHDHLRDMGREIVEASVFPRRLWRPNENIDNVFQQISVITEVRGIRMCSFSRVYMRSEIPWKKRWIHELFWNRRVQLPNKLYNTRSSGIGMRNLQLLDTEDGMLEQILRRVHSPNLIWLRWRRCPYHSLPYWIPIESLRVLQVFGRCLKTLWHGKSQAPLQLRELAIGSCLAKLPKSIGQLKHLELIVLSRTNLQTLPDEFCHLLSLKRLELTYSKIKSLPESLGCLTNLEHIDMSYSYHLPMLPNSFQNLIKLKYLDMKFCCNLTLETQTFGNIGTLEYVNFSFCQKIEILPLQVACQRSLLRLYLRGTNLKELPGAIGDLTDLKILELGSATPELPELLGFFSLRDWKKFDSVVNNHSNLVKVGKLPNTLIKLGLQGCPRVKRIDELCGLAKLQMLDISVCTEVEELPSIETLVSLEQLTACTCVKLKSIQGLAQLKKLRLIDVKWCSELEELSGVEYCISLEMLNVYGCQRLQWAGGVVEQLGQKLRYDWRS